MMANRPNPYRITDVMRKRILCLILTLGMPIFLNAQQTADTLFNPVIRHPAYPRGEGPIVLVDEAHHNFHTLGGGYRAFGRVLQCDGYIVKPSSTPFDKASLQEADILVVSNALHERNVEDWSRPTPSAFTQEEITAVSEWVESGGSLFLIADHMPFPGATEDLAAVFGFRLNNGFAIDDLIGLEDKIIPYYRLRLQSRNRRGSEQALLKGLENGYFKYTLMLFTKV